MKKKQFMSKLAALTMAAAMGVTALPATVMAAGVKDVTANNDTAADAATTGLVQTTLSAPITGGDAAATALYDAYKQYDDHVEAKIANLDQESTADDVKKALEDSTKLTNNNTIDTVAATDITDFTITPAKGHTAETAGSATVTVNLHYEYGDSNTPAQQALTLNVKWGTQVQDALDAAQAELAQSIAVTKSPAANYRTLSEKSNYYNSTTDAFSEDLVKGVTLNSPTDFAAKYTEGGVTYTAAVAVKGASGYVAPTATTDGHYNVSIELTVTGKQSSDEVSKASRTDNYTVTIPKLGSAVISKVEKDGTATASVFTTASAEAEKAYDIDVIVSGTDNGTAIATYTPAAGTTQASETVKKANLTFTSSDTSTAEIVESKTSNTGYAVRFHKPGKVTIKYTCPNYKDANATSSSAVTSYTGDLAEVTLENTPQALKSVVDGLAKTVNQADAADADAALNAAKKRVADAITAYYGRSDVTVKVDAVSSFQAATAGTAEDPDGTDGSFYATVEVTDNSNTAVAVTTTNTYKFTIKATAYTAKFTDVSDTSFCAKAVAWAVDKGITTGTTATTFSPNAPVTRAQFVTFLYRQAGSPDVAVNTKFTDIADQPEVFQKAISWAAANGITMGTTDPTKFAPGTTVTRAQAVTFLFRYAKGEATTKTNSFPDVSEDAFCADAVNWGVENGVIKGYDDGRFGTNDPTTRGQAITFIYRALAD